MSAVAFLYHWPDVCSCILMIAVAFLYHWPDVVVVVVVVVVVIIIVVVVVGLILHTPGPEYLHNGKAQCYISAQLF